MSCATDCSVITGRSKKDFGQFKPKEVTAQGGISKQRRTLVERIGKGGKHMLDRIGKVAVLGTGVGPR